MPNYTFVRRSTQNTHITLIVLSLALLAAAALLVAKRMTRRGEATAPMTARIAENYGKVPLHFEANQGQYQKEVKYLTRGKGYSIALTPQAAVLELQNEKTATVEMKLNGANTNARITSSEPLEAKMNYFIGNDPKQWKTDVPTFAKVKYEQVYPGTDVVYYGNQQQLEYDFIVAPQADPSAIKLQFDGVNAMRLDEAGNLLLATEAGEVKQHKPILYQEVAGERRAVEGGYRLENNEASFAIGEYDRSLPLVIDPVIAYSTLISSSGVFDTAIKVGANGNAFIAGWSHPLKAATTPGAPTVAVNNPTVNWSFGYIAKFNSTGTNLLYAAIIGGSTPTVPNGRGGFHMYNRIHGFDIDAQGNAYMTGWTDAADFPTTNGVLQPKRATYSNKETFIAKLSPTGNSLLYSTFLGNANAGAIDIAAGKDGQAVITGTFAGDCVIKDTLRATSKGSDDVFVAKLNATASDLIFFTPLGNASSDKANAIAMDQQGNIYTTGETYNGQYRDSTTQELVWGPIRFPTTPGAYQTSAAEITGSYIAKLDTLGKLVYSTLLPNVWSASGPNHLHNIAVDAAGCAYVLGTALVKLNAEGSGLLFSGNVLTGRAGGLGVDAAGNVYFGERINDNARVVKLSAQGFKVAYSQDVLGCEITGVAVDPAGNAYATGLAVSPGKFISTPNAYWTERQPEQSAGIVVKISETTPLPSPTAYRIRGTVSLRIGQSPYPPSEGVKVVLQGAVTRTTMTDSFGRYLFDLVPAGYDYTVVPDPVNYLSLPGTASVKNLSNNQVFDFQVDNKEAHYVSHVSAASYNLGPLATESIVSAFGTNLTTLTLSASELPLPTDLGGTKVKVKDSYGNEKFAELIFVSPTQINYVMPPYLASGQGIVTITGADGNTFKGTIQIETTTPGLFAADASGRGIAAAKVQRVKPDGTQKIEEVVGFDPIRGQLVALPIDLGPAGDKVYLTLYATGVRHRRLLTGVSATIGGRSVEVSYAGSQLQFTGLDQINVMIPRDMAGRGEVDVVVNVEGRVANPVRVKIK